MTEETKKLIDELPTSRVGFGDEMRELVYKSDLIRIVEELTKWNKLKDGFPDTGRQLLAKFRDGDIEVAWYLSHKYRDCSFYSRCEPDIDFILEDIIEWKYTN